MAPNITKDILTKNHPIHDKKDQDASDKKKEIGFESDDLKTLVNDLVDYQDDKHLKQSLEAIKDKYHITSIDIAKRGHAENGDAVLAFKIEQDGKLFKAVSEIGFINYTDYEFKNKKKDDANKKNRSFQRILVRSDFIFTPDEKGIRKKIRYVYDYNVRVKSALSKILAAIDQSIQYLSDLGEEYFREQFEELDDKFFELAKTQMNQAELETPGKGTWAIARQKSLKESRRVLFVDNDPSPWKFYTNLYRTDNGDHQLMGVAEDPVLLIKKAFPGIVEPDWADGEVLPSNYHRVANLGAVHSEEEPVEDPIKKAGAENSDPAEESGEVKDTGKKPTGKAISDVFHNYINNDSFNLLELISNLNKACQENNLDRFEDTLKDLKTCVNTLCDQIVDAEDIDNISNR